MTVQIRKVMTVCRCPAAQSVSMSLPRRTCAATTAAVITAIATIGCSPASTYDQRMTYLRKVAGRGVDTYKLLYSQEAQIDKGRCERAFVGNGVINDAPDDVTGGGETPEWRAQVKEFFVDSCISGKPKPVPGDLPDPAASQPSTTPSPTAPSTATPTSTH
ncbi:hypothetical protein ABZ815_51130 [Nonomuraea sp. NPDC047529]|uniref:hypothetical protein n=1 Tax=Nonomuraea sp. NPDC047529 TaxID=3155623 RepID=UPI0033DE2BC2